MDAATTLLTGTDVLNRRICPAYCWTVAHRADLVPAPTEHEMRREQDEHRVVRIAQRGFSDGVVIEAEDPLMAARRTIEAIADGARTIFGATAISPDGWGARADILTRQPKGEGWLLIDVRASTSLDADKRFDAAFQRIVFEAAGLEIAGLEIRHLNKRYQRNGHLDPENLFRSDTGIMRWSQSRRREIEREMVQTAELLASPSCPSCGCDRTTRGRRCPTFSVFHPGFPAGDTVFDLISINKTRLAEVMDRGVTHLADWPDDLELSQRQQWQVDVVRSGVEIVCEDLLREFLGGVSFPCHFLDYETFQVPVPLHTGTWPYQQIPFQYSVHVLHEDGRLEHREFLWTDADASPVEPLVEALRADIADEGSVLVWWKGFEGRRNEELARLVPRFEQFLHGLNARMIDLMDSVTRGMWIHPDFGGSASIKNVLPVVDPSMSYDELEIGHGSVATLRWKQCVVDSAPPDGIDPEEAFAHLREYCRQDTLALVRIWEHLCRLADVGVPSMSW